MHTDGYCFIICNVLKKLDLFWQEWEWGVRYESDGLMAFRIDEGEEAGLRGR